MGYGASTGQKGGRITLEGHWAGEGRVGEGVQSDQGRIWLGGPEKKSFRVNTVSGINALDSIYGKLIQDSPVKT